jgi:aspartate/methionine/tyrosine aminotransferase
MNSVHHQNCNLTELEVFGLSSEFNLADGHSYVSAKKHYKSVLSDLPELWEVATNTSVPKMERLFKEKFANYFSLDGLKHHEHFSVCPTASNSIDIVGAWARSKQYTIGLMEPTFDNLAHLLRRREVSLEAIPETGFTSMVVLESFILRHEINALFLVNPNNPTGFVINSTTMALIADLCLKLDITLIIDTSFRFCHRIPIDEYAILINRGLSFIILEDTGKQWPTLDTKVSLLSYSENLANDIRKIYEEIYLCCSNFSLQVIIAFIDATINKGGISYIHSIIQKNIKIVRSELQNTLVVPETVPHDSLMTVMWLNIEKTGFSDLEFTDYLAQYDIAVLPGRYFYWDSHDSAGHNRIRIALMKPDDQFHLSILRLKQALHDLEMPKVAERAGLTEILL